MQRYDKINLNRTGIQVHGSIPYEDLRRFGIMANDISDFSATINPHPLSPLVENCFNANGIASYPDDQCHEAIEAIHRFYSIPSDFFTFGVGTSEIIFSFPHLFKRPIQFGPTYGDYQAAFERHGFQIITIKYPEDNESFLESIDQIEKIKADIVIICNPNNPDGKNLSEKSIRLLCQKLENSIICIDESYQEMSENCQTVVQITPDFHNLLVLKSLTKPFGIGGIRAGYAIGNPAIIKKIKKFLIPWGISTIAQRYIPVLFQEYKYYQEQWDLIKVHKDKMYCKLQNINFEVIKSVCPYLLINVGDSEMIRQQLLKKYRIAVRSCTSFSLPEFIRVMPGDEEKNKLILNAFQELNN